MLWPHYVFRRGTAVNELWDRFFDGRAIRLLYISGRGFDPRAQSTLTQFIRSLRAADAQIESSELLLIGLSRYELDEALKKETEDNANALVRAFSQIGSTSEITIDAKRSADEDVSTSSALRRGVEEIVGRLNSRTDIVLDVSSLPRVVYLAIMTGILQKLIPNKHAEGALTAGGVNFQILVAEDSELDSAIRSEDPSADLVTIPGFASALYAESVQEWPMVWFPILGENRLGQFNIVNSSIPGGAEICPIIPHPSKDLRRAERLLVEYKSLLFDRLQTPVSNALYVSESNPFEAYRQLLSAMERYRKSLNILGGCRLAVTPLSSKLVTIGAGLACFDMRPENMDHYGVTMPYAEPMRYLVSAEELHRSRAEIAALVLTGHSYS